MLWLFPLSWTCNYQHTAFYNQRFYRRHIKRQACNFVITDSLLVLEIGSKIALQEREIVLDIAEDLHDTSLTIQKQLFPIFRRCLMLFLLCKHLIFITIANRIVDM